MFSRRRNLDSGRKYSREFFETLTSDLNKAGFSDIQVKLPYNLVGVGVDNCVISPQELIERERNYPSLILIATNPERNDTLKALFVNRSSKVVFIDDTFPSGESGPPALFFQSPDPGRAFSVFEFFHEYLKKPSLTVYRLLWLGSMAALVVVISEVISLLFTGQGVLASRLHQPLGWDVLISTASLVLLFRFFAEPKGLWIKPERELRLMQLANMAIRGDLKDNPLVSLVVTVVGTILATLVLKWLGVI